MRLPGVEVSGPESRWLLYTVVREACVGAAVAAGLPEEGMAALEGRRWELEGCAARVLEGRALPGRSGCALEGRGEALEGRDVALEGRNVALGGRSVPSVS